LTHGLSGSGKSSQSQSLIEQRGMVRLRADVERKRLFGLAPEASSAGMGAGGIYTAEASRRTHERLAQLARSTLAAGFPVLVDATFLNRGHRAAFIALAHTLQLPCRILAFEAPLEVLRERVRQRARTGTDASEATLAVLEAQRAKAQPFTAAEEARVLHVDTTRPVDWSVLLPQETAPLMHQQTGPQG
jgi:predicted kinase